MSPRLPSVLVAVAYGALVIAVWGLTSLVLDDDVVHYSDAGPLLGPAMASAAMLTTWVWVVRVRTGGGLVVSGLGAAASAWFAMVVIGALGYMLTTGVFAWFLLFVGDYAPSAFTVVPAAIAGAAVAIAGFFARAKPFARPSRED